MINQENKGIITYYRVSTKSQGESGLGLEAQKALIAHYFNSNNIIKEFKEVASGKYYDASNRPLLCEAIKLCKENNYTLVVAKVDRLSRITEHALSIYGELEGNLQSCDIPNLDKFTLTLFMAIADREREMIGLRTKQALTALKNKGIKLGVSSSVNFTNKTRLKGAKSNQLKASTHKANVQATELILIYKKVQKMSFRAIMDKLNENGYKTSRDKLFSVSTVKMLYDRAI
jgi:DNA invertase Pin-like site-specific DNA recombinase